ncbi:MAG: DUF4430 domain-containing protein, partial [Clostridiales Family XIII bacterium]|nr:DUF4430 domain-containing protein [Clostridiales Family XIII bacterium]
IGDEVRVRFDNINNPIPKISKVYNPGYNFGTIFKDGRGTVRILYDMNGEEVSSGGTQYGLHIDSSLDIIPDDIGSYNFEGGRIVSTVMSYFGFPAHRSLADAGYGSGLLGTAGEYGPYFHSVLPSFSFDVGLNDAEDEAIGGDTGRLDFTRLAGLTLPASPQVAGYNVSSPFNISFPDEHSYHQYAAFARGVSGLPVRVDGINFREEQSASDYDIYWRYWKEGGEKSVATLQASMPAQSVPWTSGSLTIPNANSTDILYGEVIVSPKNGDAENTAYSILFGAGTNGSTGGGLYPFFRDLEIAPADHAKDYIQTDGLLKVADTARIEGDETLGLGYGYLFSERDYAMTVPGAAEAIDIQPYPFFNSVLGSENIGRIDVYVDEEPFKTVYPTDIDPQSESAAISMEDFAPIEDIRLNASGETKIELRLAFNEKVQTEYTKAFFYKNADWYKANPETDKPEGVVYTITVNRPDAGADALLNVPAGVTATFRDSITGNALSPKEEGGNAYSLRAGDYALDLSGTRYYKKSLSVSVTEDGGEYAMKVVDGDKEYPITPGEGGAFTIDALSYLAVAPDASGKQVGVRVVGYDGTVRDTVITVPAETPDLTSYINEYNKEGKLKYVRANAGGYTALHSVIDALLPGDGWDGLRFSCVNGKLTPGVVFSKTNHGADWGWLCRVDGKLVNPAETALEGGETVVFHYNAALAGQQYASIEDAPTSLPRNRDLSFKLLGTDVASNDEAAPVEDAEIYIDGALWDDVSSEDGVYTLTGLRDLPIGDHTIVAKKVDGNGVNTLTYAAAEIDLLASVVESDEPDAWSVSEAKDRIGAVFDANLNAIYSKANYETLKALRDGGFAAVEGAGMPAAIKTMAEYTITAINEQAARMQPSVLVGASLADPDGTVRLSFEDRVKRPSSGYITEPNPLGDIISSLDVPYKEGDTMEDVTVRALTALGLASEMDGNAEYQSAYLSSIGEFYLPGGKYVQTLAEFSNGEGSGWMITLNGWFIDRGISSFTVADGDSVRWQYTCNLGADLGSEAATGGANAEIMGLSFGTSGTLYPAYSSDVTSYTYTVPAGTEGVKVAARLSSHNSTATYEAGGLAYNEGATIPVKDGAEITITSNYSDGNKTDRRVVTITVRVEGEGGALPEPTDPPDTSADGALYAALGYLGAGVTNPIMDSVGGEWAVVALARAGVGDPDAQVYQNYLKNLETAASAKIASTDPDTQVNKVVFRDRRITDNERVVVALSALGKDASAYTASDGKTYDFLSAILDRQAAPNDGEYQAVVQGINGAIFALLALDSGGYLLPEDEPAGTVPLSADESGTVGVLDADDPASAEALESGDPASVEPLEGNDTPTVGPGTAARAYYLNFVLGREKNTGGWALGGEKDAAGDPDITGMTLQALARYYKMDDAAYAPYADAGAPALADIKAAVGRALTMLKDAQNEETGGFNHGGETSESAAQVLTGLSALGTDGTEDGSLFASVLANLLTYRNEATGAFVHVKGSDKGAQMATEQATYALVAYTRYVAGLAPLYDMSDVRVDPDTGAASFGWAFDYVPPISLTAINNAIAKARGLTEASYTAQTWANLQEALRKAQTAAAKEDATQDEIDAAARALNAAISALKAKETPLGPGGGEETPLPYDDNTLADGTVNVHADAGVIPSGALITADRQGISTALADAIKKQFGKDSLVYAVLDINLLQNGAKVLPNGLVEIRVAIDPAWDRTGLAVLRAEDDGSFTNMNARIENDFLVFTTDHFSNYIVAKLANPQGVATVTSAANAAQTGDDTQPELWLALGLIALLLLAAGVIGYRRLRQKGQKDDGSVLS